MARGEGEVLREQHANYYLALVEAAESHFHRTAPIIWADRLEFEHDNFRAALA